MTWPAYSPACRKAVDALLKNGGSLSAYRANPLFPSWTGPLEGSYAYKLEREIERRFKVRHAVAVNSGTAALHAAIVSALPKPRGEAGEIITSPYTFSATAASILLSGFTPVFADVDPYSFNITPETIKPQLTKKTKGILPVSLFGGMADVQGMRALGYPVIEDACQAVGARDSHGFSGSQAVAAAYSMNGGKNIPAGEAGCMVTQDDRVAEKARLFMNHGENFHKKDIGVNYRMNEITACVAYHGLLELEERNRRRIELAKAVDDNLTNMFSPGWAYDGSNVFYVAAFRLQQRYGSRERFIKRMKRKGIPVGKGYITPPLHKYRAFRQYARGPLPVVEGLSSKTLCVLSTLTPDRPLSYAQDVAKAMKECLK